MALQVSLRHSSVARGELRNRPSGPEVMSPRAPATRRHLQALIYKARELRLDPFWRSSSRSHGSNWSISSLPLVGAVQPRPHRPTPSKQCSRLSPTHQLTPPYPQGGHAPKARKLARRPTEFSPNLLGFSPNGRGDYCLSKGCQLGRDGPTVSCDASARPTA